MAIDSITAEERAHFRITPNQAARFRISRVAIGMGFAAAILMVVLFGPSLLVRNYRSEGEAGLSIVLSDSSTVTLGKNTSLTVRSSFFRSARGVDVEGEAYFNMKPQRSPFIVSTWLGAIGVVGTRFDVRCDGRVLYVAVNHGTV
ncbi:MAG TPA: FecR family protein, partial [Bacteroidota bacterium]|nr:FecR family protein [Bacteroidota bacterium]